MTRKQKKNLRRNKARLLRAGTQLERALLERWRFYINFHKTMRIMEREPEGLIETEPGEPMLITCDTRSIDDNTMMIQISASAHPFYDQALEHAVNAFDLPASTWRKEA